MIAGSRTHLTLLTLLLGAVAHAQSGAHAVERDVTALEDGPRLEPPSLAKDSPAPWPEFLQAGARGEPTSGTVGLELLIGADGRVEEVELVSPLHPQLDAAAMEAARGLLFHPARLGDDPVAVRAPFEYRFLRPPPVGALKLVVRTRGTRNPIEGAQLFEAEGGELGVTDANGELRLELPVGKQPLVLIAGGHSRATLDETIVEGEERSVLVRLRADGENPYEAVVRADPLARHLGTVELQGAELAEAPGTLGDPLRVVMMMPGVGQVASGVGYPVVRGSLPASTATYVDGVRVPILFHLLLGPSVVHPDAIEKIDFTPGIASVEHGSLMTGSVEASLREPGPTHRVSVAADLINAGGVVDGRIDATGTELLVGGRFSYTPWLLSQLDLFSGDAPEGQRMRAVADFWDYVARVEQPWRGSRTRVLLLGSSDYAGVDSEAADGMDTFLVTRFHRADARIQLPVAGGELELGLGAGTQAAGVLGQQGEQRMDLLLEQQDVGARASWRTRGLGDFALALGVDADRLFAATRMGSEVTPSPLLAHSAHGTRLGAWTELEWNGPSTSVVAGVRADSYHLVPGLTRFSFDPRLTVRQTIAPGLTVQLGAGISHQPPTALLPMPVMSLSALRFGLQEAIGVDASLEWTPAPGWDVRLNGYATRLTRAIELDIERLLRDVRGGGRLTSDPSTEGNAAGLELLVRKHLGGRWYGWASYGLQRSVRDREVVHFDARGLPLSTETVEVPFAFDQTHVGNVAVTVRLDNGWTLGGGVRAQTGRPETGQLSSFTQVEDVDPVTGAPRWRAVAASEAGRLPPFFRLDLRVAKRWTFDDNWVELSLDLMNATFSQEVVGYNYGERYDFETGESRLERFPMTLPIVVPLIGIKGEL